MTRSPFVSMVEKYSEKDPVSAAHTLETISESDAAAVIGALPNAVTVEIMRHLRCDFAAAVMEKIPRELLRAIAEKMDLEHGAAIFLHLNPETRQAFLACLDDSKKRRVQAYLTYPEASAGRMMSGDFLAFHSDLKIAEATEKIRELTQQGSLASYVYVVDQENRLVGVMNMRDMLLASSDDALETVMRRNVFTVHCCSDREKVVHEIAARHFFAVPVVDHDQRLLGVVKAEQLIGDAQEEATGDIQKMFGAGGDERVFSSIGFSLRQRLPWLHVNLATAFLAGSVVALFEDVIAKITALAIYLPVIAGQGGNAGAQSLAVVMRGLVMREIPSRKWKNLILKESVIGLVNGLVIGVVTALLAWLWQGNPVLGVVVGLGMLVNLTVAGLSGAAIPLFMKGVGLDPAQCSNIILTTITDVFGFFAFLGIAVIFRNYL
ncbi:MAG: magnesium transporter [Candidatus Omnitrophica bacterium]|nr:magnesium transporter [Candidatus Omnitrophota bacterium]MDD5670146.1 magnesium transporter [Candidatus Omnitrophota bacterium]